MVSDKKLKPGVYLRPSGHLSLLLRETVLESGFKYKWSYLDGKRTQNKIMKFLYKAKTVKELPLMAWELHSDDEFYDAWGPANVLNRSEYLGEL